MKRHQQDKEEKKRRQRQDEQGHKPQKEHKWRRIRGENEIHNEAYTVDQKSDKDGQGGKKDEKEDRQVRSSPQELPLLRLSIRPTRGCSALKSVARGVVGSTQQPPVILQRT